MKRSWDELVAEGERLKVMEERIEAEAGNIRWLWGDLALEVAPMGARTGPADGVNDRLQRFADELDVSFQSLRQYRAVAEAWPLGMRVPNQPWVVHQQIMGRDDREELIATPVDVRTGERTDRWTYRNMQRYLGKKPSPHYQAPPTTTEEKAEVARDLLEDPEVAKAALADPGVAVANVRDALEERKPTPGDPIPPPDKSFDERCSSWVTRLNTLMTEGAKLAAEAESVGHASDVAASHLAILLYDRLTERQFDVEIRRLLDTEGA